MAACVNDVHSVLPYGHVLALVRRCPAAGTVADLTEALVCSYACLWNQMLACSCVGTLWDVSLFVFPSVWQRFRDRAMKTERLMIASVAQVPDCCGIPK